MYKALLSDYEQRQKQLLIENAELKKVLQQMKKEIISLLPPQKQKPKERSEDGPVSSVEMNFVWYLRLYRMGYLLEKSGVFMLGIETDIAFSV